MLQGRDRGPGQFSNGLPVRKKDRCGADGPRNGSRLTNGTASSGAFREQRRKTGERFPSPDEKKEEGDPGRVGTESADRLQKKKKENMGPIRPFSNPVDSKKQGGAFSKGGLN